MSTHAPTAADLAAPARRGFPKLLMGVVLAVIVVALALSYWFFVGRFYESTDDAYVGGEVTVLAPKVNGFIGAVLVRDNQKVEANQLLVRLDARDYAARLAEAQAEVSSANAAVGALQAKRSLQDAVVAQQRAAVSAAAAELARTAADHSRYSELVRDDAVSNQVLEKANADDAKARAALAGSQAALLAAQREAVVMDSEIGQAQARVAQTVAAQQLAALNVDYTELRAPVAGYIGNRTARVGALAMSGSALITVVPSSGLWVDANFKEDQLKKLRVGDHARVKLDASGDALDGVVESLAPATGATFSLLPADNATGNFTRIVQRVPVRIRLLGSPAQLAALRPGLSAEARVSLDSVRASNN
ncbi:MAG: HlyD family secretion protein [Janthinobacterium lividum]